MRRAWSVLLVVVLSFCPLASGCFAQASGHGAAAPSSAAGDHGPSHHGHSHDGHSHHGPAHRADHPAPAGAVPDGGKAFQHCAPFASPDDAPATATVFDFAAARFPPPAASAASGMDYDPDVPPPRPLS